MVKTCPIDLESQLKFMHTSFKKEEVFNQAFKLS